VTVALNRLPAITGRTQEQVRPADRVRALLFAKLGHRSVVDRAAVWRDRPRACFAKVAGVAEVLAGGPIGGDLQAHLAVCRSGLPGPTPGSGSVPVRTNGRSVCGDRRRPFTNGKLRRGVRMSTALNAQAFRRRRCARVRAGGDETGERSRALRAVEPPASARRFAMVPAGVESVARTRFRSSYNAVPVRLRSGWQSTR